MVLVVENLTKTFGKLKALDDVSFAAGAEQITALIGPNGAGKTTLFNIAAGVERASHGRVLCDARELTRLQAAAVARLGVRRTFQNVRLFGEMTVLENVQTGLHTQAKSSWVEAALRLPRVAEEERRFRDRAQEALEFVGLGEFSAYRAGALSYGRQRLLEIARALVVGPRLLLLDEPAAGLNEAETHALSTLLQRIRARGISLLLIEHDMRLVMNVSDHVVVLNYGRKIAEGAPAEVQANPDVVEAYLGRRRQRHADSQ